MSISLRNNRALNRVLRESLRDPARSDPPPPQEEAKPEAPAYTLCADIPERYNDSYVRAIPKDPQNTFVYWELPKEQAEAGLFADVGTAHVENGEAVRIGERLNESRRKLQADNGRNADGGGRQDPVRGGGQVADNGHHQVFWDAVGCSGFVGGNQQPQRGQDDCRPVDRVDADGRIPGHGDGRSQDNRRQYDRNDDNQYIRDGGYLHHHRGAGDQFGWNGGDQYSRDDGYQHYPRRADGQYNWSDGGQYRVDDAYQYLRNFRDGDQRDWSDGGRRGLDDAYQRRLHHQDDLCRFVWDGGGNYAPRGGGGGDAAFSEMLEALIARCNQYIADYRQSGSGPLARALSSGLLCGANANVGNRP